MNFLRHYKWGRNNSTLQASNSKWMQSYLNFPITNTSEKRVVKKEKHSRIWRTTLKNAFRYVPVPGGMRLIRSGSCSMNLLQTTGIITRCHGLVHLHHGEDCVLNSMPRYKFVSNVKVNHAIRWEQQPILLPSHLFSSLPRDTQRKSVRLCFPDQNTTIRAGTVGNWSPSR